MKILLEESQLKYDSTADTLKHIKDVNDLLGKCATELIKRGKAHDASKLKSPEKALYDEMTPLLKGVTYGSKEYKGMLKKLEPALKHHYQNNSHHPEYYPNGLNGMDLFDLIEMAMDWIAATRRHSDGDIMKSLEINSKRFSISPQLHAILKNTFEKKL